MMMPETFIGCPESSVGEKRARRAASTAAPRNIGGPLVACAATTFPSTSIETSTVTVPVTPARLAISGYSGFGKLISLLLTTLLEISLACGFGVGLGVGLDDAGGGGSSTAATGFRFRLSVPVGASNPPFPLECARALSGRDNPESGTGNLFSIVSELAAVVPAGERVLTALSPTAVFAATDPTCADVGDEAGLSSLAIVSLK